MQKIVPHLWFDKEAVEAANFYVAIFPDSRMKYTAVVHDTPSGSVDMASFEIMGLEIQAIGAGPMFKLNPSISFQVILKSKAEVDQVWDRLAQNGQVLMELAEYPFSERYGWVQDRYGLSWQIFYSGETQVKAQISPMLMFVGSVYAKAEEAIRFWISVFGYGKVHELQRYGPGAEPDREGAIQYGTFSLFGQVFRAMDSGYEHNFAFNEAFSLMVNCETQAEIDAYWEKLSADPEAEQCGWLKDRYGVSWQILPARMDEWMRSGSREQIDRVTQAYLPMKKLDIAVLEEAYAGK